VIKINSGDFATRVIVGGSATAVLCALVGAFVGGVPALIGVGVGAAVAIGNFAWLARAAVSTAEPTSRRRTRVVALLLIRHLVTFAALGAPVAAGVVHPLALAAGLTVLPVTLTIQGLRTVRQEG
jgi:MFS family permease